MLQKKSHINVAFFTLQNYTNIKSYLPDVLIMQQGKQKKPLVPGLSPIAPPRPSTVVLHASDKKPPSSPSDLASSPDSSLVKSDHHSDRWGDGVCCLSQPDCGLVSHKANRSGFPRLLEIPRDFIIMFKDLEIPVNFVKYVENRENSLNLNILSPPLQK